jgi:hypothetical protein
MYSPLVAVGFIVFQSLLQISLQFLELINQCITSLNLDLIGIVLINGVMKLSTSFFVTLQAPF